MLNSDAIIYRERPLASSQNTYRKKGNGKMTCDKAIFTADELYSMVSAARASIDMSAEGFDADWTDHLDDEEMADCAKKYDSLPESVQHELDEKLLDAAETQEANYYDLDNLEDDAYSTVNVFMDARQEIIDKMKDEISGSLNDFLAE